MLADYADITSRIAEAPTWWDEHGVPRYGEPGPDMAADIYAEECALVLIACQSCRREFPVLFTRGMLERALHPDGPTLRRLIEDGTIHYGDPPRHDWKDCGAGDTMNCLDLRVLSYWRRGKLGTQEPAWVPVPELVRELPDAAPTEDDDR